MTTKTDTPKIEGISEPKPKTPRSEHNRTGAGRIPRDRLTVDTQARLDHLSAYAVTIVEKHIKRQRGFKHLPADLQRQVEFVIDHTIGKARQKIEHSGGILTYGNLAKEAEKIASKPRDVLADAEEIATKRQRLADLADPETAQRRAGLEQMLARADELPEVEARPEAEPEPEPPPDSAGLKPGPGAEGSNSNTQGDKADEPSR